ncbi:MAG: hypothetical protein V1775_07790 [Bacteroidota bacterium]
MIITRSIKLFGFMLMVSLLACKSKSHLSESQNPAKVTGPQVVIYKTKDNYFQHVPVILSKDKKSLISYPAPSDVFYNGDLAYPVKLESDFLLDRRGINEGCAFLKWTYYEYSRLDHTPTQAEFMKMMLETDPITELYYCGKRSNFKDIEAELNQVIREGKLDQYNRIK